MALSQGHDGWISRISTVEDAKTYASKHKDVIVSFVNYEKDPFLFDEVDTSRMEEQVGKSHTLFGRTTKFLKDTSLLMVDLQLIEFDTSTAEETTNVLHGQILKKLRDGESYWSLKKKYAHTSTSFTSGPELVDEILVKYQVDLHNSMPGAIYESNLKGRKVILIVNKVAHEVPGFYAISYNSGN